MRAYLLLQGVLKGSSLSAMCYTKVGSSSATMQNKKGRTPKSNVRFLL